MKFLLATSAALLLYANLVCSLDDSSEYGLTRGERITNCTCGTINKPKGRLVGAEEAGRNVWPMVAEISTVQFHLCMGTVITQRHVLTAAHCGIHPYSFQKLPADMFDVYVEIYEIAGDNAFGDGLKFGIQEFVTHPDHVSKGKKNDIAVIYLSAEIEFTHLVAPACLPLGSENMFYEKLTALGWGRQYHGDPNDSPVLMKVKIDVVDHVRCRKIYRNYKDETNFCMYTPGKDACQGDSGGPLLWRDPETNRYVLVAIVSYGRNCGKYPGVYVNVMHFLPWIQKVISETNSSYLTCAKK